MHRTNLKKKVITIYNYNIRMNEKSITIEEKQENCKLPTYSCDLRI